MSKPVLFLDNVVDSPHGSLIVKKSPLEGNWCVDNLLGHFDGFPFSDLYNIKHINLFSNDTIKYLLGFIHMPVISAPFLSKEAIDLLQTEANLFLVLLSVHEYIITPKELSKYLKRNNISSNKVIVMCSNIESHGQTLEGVKYVTINFWESYSRMHLKVLPGSTIITADERLSTIDSASKKFISLNRNIKPHRIWWYYSLLSNDFVDQGHVSFHLPSINKGEFLETCKSHWVLKRIPENLHNDFLITSARKMFTRKLDILDRNNVINYKDTVKQYYLDSLVSIVTESESTKNFITEKTYKAIANLHPFFIIGNPDQHTLLRARGYYTFEDMFGIDSVMDYEQAITLINNLKNIDIKKLKHDIKEKYFDKLLHNQQNFLNRKTNWQTILDTISKTFETEKI